jgi:ankyrin repeat protein
MYAGGATPLMLAAGNAHEKVIAELLEKGARVDMTDQTGQTALHYVILGDPQWPYQPLDPLRKRIIRLLLAAGADPRIQDEHGNDALYYYKLVASLALRGCGYISDPEFAEEDQLYQEMRS